MTEYSDPAIERAHEVKYSALGHQVLTQVSQLQRGFMGHESWAVAALAQLRRGVNKQPGEIIELLEWTSPGIFVADDRSDTATPEEYAAHVALTLYATHQQGHTDRGMHRANGDSFGTAARALRLELGEHGGAGVVRRFNAIGTSTNPNELARHAQGLIRQLRTARISLDYATLADDLVKLSDPARAANVRNRWGRHFHRYVSAPTDKTGSVEPHIPEQNTPEQGER